MSISTETMQTLLLLCIIGCALLAMLYLRERRLTALAYALWGLLALCLPLLGTMLVMIARPGGSLHKPPAMPLRCASRHR